MSEEKNESEKLNLNPFPVSSKPIFKRLGILLGLMIALWIVLHGVDVLMFGKDKPKSSPAEQTKQEQASTTIPKAPKYKTSR